MTTRSKEMTVFFARPFHLSEIDGVQPSGTYRLVVDEEDVSGLNFTAFRRKATMLHLPALEFSVLSRQVVSVDAEEFEAAVAADQHR